MLKHFQHLLAYVLAALLSIGSARAESTIDPNLPANGVPYSASTIRGQFDAAVNDINALQSMNVGTSAPFSCTLANLGRLWLDNTANPYVAKQCNGSGGTWVPIGYLDVSANIYTPTTGRGTCQSIVAATTTDLGSVPQSCITVTGNSGVSITSLGSTAKAGDIKIVTFNGTNTLVYNATSLILPGGINATTSAGDTWLFQSLGSGNWTAVSRAAAISTATATAAPGTGTNIAGFLNAAAASVTMSADGVVVCTALSGGVCYLLGSYSQTFNSATTGAGGMDTGTLPSSGYVCIYAIYNPVTATKSILGVNCSTSSTTIYGSSNLPSGYTASALIAAWPTNSTPNMVAGAVNGRTFSYQSGVIVLNASTTAQASPTSLSVSSAVPPNATAVNSFDVSVVGNGSQSAQLGTLGIFPTSVGGGVGTTVIATLANTTAQTWNFAIPRVPITAAQTIYYTAPNLGTNVSGTIAILSYSW